MARIKRTNHIPRAKRANRTKRANRLPLFAPLFEHPVTVRDLIRHHIFRDWPDAVRQLDFDNMERVPDDWVPVGPRCADCVWSIPLLRHPDQEKNSPTHVLFLLRFEPRVVADMKDRLDRHAESLLREVGRRAVFGAPEAPPHVTPVAIYYGKCPEGADSEVPSAHGVQKC